MRTVYFDTSVFFAIFKGEPAAKEIELLMNELKQERIRIYTSIITVQEVSVLAFRHGGSGNDNHAKVSNLARIIGITKEIALAAAKLEARMIDSSRPRSGGEKIAENRRRKWDCFHIATALDRKCGALYALDEELLKKKDRLDVGDLQFLTPRAVKPPLPFER